ncbi:MAG: rod shape-determining protein MreC [Spirochaetaceae bacterium]|nr:rod shape-determining protein MreC [Spirochaetaceae bacterium]
MEANGSRQAVNSFVSRHRAGAVLVVLVALGTIMMILSHRPVAAASERMGRSVFSSLQLAMHEVGAFFGGSWNTIAELRRMRVALVAARQRLLELEQLSSDMAELERQNDELRRQLGFEPPPTFRHLPAEVMARAPGNQFTNLTIDRGIGDGVRADMVVVALQDGVQGLVGRVVEVDRRSALVQPISARTSFVAARLRDLRYDGLVQGLGSASNTLLMRHVNSAASEMIEAGEPVITSGLGGVFPAGVLIGAVRMVRSETSGNALDIELQPAIEVARLEYLFVIVPQER